MQKFQSVYSKMSRRNLDLAMCVKKAANCGAVERRGSAQENCPAEKSPLTESPSGHGHSVCAVSIRQVGLIDESAAAFRAARPGRPIGDLCKATVREKWKMVEGDGFEPSYAKRPDLQSGGFNHSPTPPQGPRKTGGEFRSEQQKTAAKLTRKSACASPAPSGERGL